MPVSISGDGIISGVSTLTTGNFITTSSISAPTATFTGNVSIGGTLTYEDVTNVDSIGIITARSGVIISGVTTVSAGSTSAPSITPTGDSNTGIFFPSADTIAFAEGGAEAVRIDSSQRLLVGTSSAGGNGRIVVSGNPVFPTGTNSFGILRIATNNTTPVNNEDLGYLEFHNATGAGSGPTISAARDGGTWTSGSSHPSRLVFSTSADGASSPTERVRISSTGLVDCKYGVKAPKGWYYGNFYSTNSTWNSGWNTVIPTNVLAGGATYLVTLYWDWNGNGGQPYYLNAATLLSTVPGTNGSSTENAVVLLSATHTGGTGTYLQVRTIAQTGGGTTGLQVNIAGFSPATGSVIYVYVQQLGY